MSWGEIATHLAPWVGAIVSIAAAFKAHEEGARAAQGTIAELRRMLEEQLIEVRRLQEQERDCHARVETLETLFTRQHKELVDVRRRLSESEKRARKLAEELASLIRDVTSGAYESPRLLTVRRSEHDDGR